MTQQQSTENALFCLQESQWGNRYFSHLNMDHSDLVESCPKGHLDSVIVRDSTSQCCCKSCPNIFDYSALPEQQRNYAIVLNQSSRNSSIRECFELNKGEIARMQKKAIEILETLLSDAREICKPIDLALLSDLYKKQAENLASIGQDELALQNYLAARSVLGRLEREEDDLNSEQLEQINTVWGLLTIEIIKLMGKLDYPAEKIKQAIDAGVQSFDNALSLAERRINKSNNNDNKEQSAQENKEDSGKGTGKEEEPINAVLALQQWLAELYLEAAQIFEKRKEKEKAIEFYLKMFEQSFPQGRALGQFRSIYHRIYDALPSLFRLLRSAGSIPKEKIIQILEIWMENCFDRFETLNWGGDEDVRYIEDFLQQIYYGARYLFELKETNLAISWLNKALETAEKVKKEDEFACVKYQPVPLVSVLYDYARLYQRADDFEKEHEILEKAIEMLEPWARIWGDLFESPEGFLCLAFLYNHLALFYLFDSFDKEQGRKAAEKSLEYGRKCREKTIDQKNNFAFELLAILCLDYTLLALFYSPEDEKKSKEMLALRDQIQKQMRELAQGQPRYQPLLEKSDSFFLPQLIPLCEPVLLLADIQKMGMSNSTYKGYYDYYDRQKNFF